MQTSDRKRPRPGVMVAAVMALAWAGHAGAFEIDTGSDDVKMRLDNKVSATLGWRVREADGLAKDPSRNSAALSEYFADKGDLYTTRFDLYSEYDLRYKRDHGLRLSAAAWYDPSFPKHPPDAFGPYSSYGSEQEWSSNTKRFYRAGAEMLDAFAFTRVELGEIPVSAKLGRTSVVWGEAMFGGAGGISSVGYAQNPNDGRKGSQNPNASLKETSLPINQLHLVANVTDTSNLSVYRAFEWRPDRVPASGTYLGFSDGISEAPYLFCNPALPSSPPCVPYLAPQKGKRGDWGVQYKIRPGFYSGNIAAIYREFAEKAPWYGAWDPTVNFPFGSARSVYGNDTRLIGLTTNTTAFDISWGAELSYRMNAALNTDFSRLATAGAGGSNFTTVATEGARGNTVHALANLQFFGGKALFWDTFVIAAEVAHARLRNVTKNAGLYHAVGANYGILCNGVEGNPKVAGCSDKGSTAVGLYLDPTLYQAITGMDLEIPVFIQRNFGNSPLNGGTTDGATTISAGLKGTLNTVHGPHVIQLNYLAFRGKSVEAGNSPGRYILGAPYLTRDQVQLTYTTSF